MYIYTVYGVQYVTSLDNVFFKPPAFNFTPLLPPPQEDDALVHHKTQPRIYNAFLSDLVAAGRACLRSRTWTGGSPQQLCPNVPRYPSSRSLQHINGNQKWQAGTQASRQEGKQAHGTVHILKA